MSDWFFTLGNERQGPVSANEIAARFLRGEISTDALVWTEGMAEWRPLRDMSTELGIEREQAPEAIIPAMVMQEPSSPYAAPIASNAPVLVAPRDQSDVVLAGFLKRFAAAFIDSMALGIVAMIIIFAGMMVLGGAGAFTPQGMANDLAQGTLGVSMILLMYGLPILVQILYFTWMHASSSQATLGKMAVGIKVCRGNGEALTLGRSFGRWCAYFALGLPCGLGTLVSAFTSGLSERKQGLHDMMVDSLVVDKWAFTAHPERQNRELGAVTWVMLVLAGLFVVGYFLLILFSIGMAAMAGANA